MLPVSLDYPFLIAPSLFSSSSPRVPNVASVSGLPILDCPIAFLLSLFGYPFFLLFTFSVQMYVMNVIPETRYVH
jgi:hypothetical protein